MNVAQIENNLQLLIKSFDEQSFIYDLLLAYGQPKASIKRLKDGGLNLSKNSGEILWKKKLFFKESKASDLHDLIDDLRIDDAITKHSPRFIIVTDYINLVARDSKTNDTLDIEILELPRHFDFFLPLAGMEKAQHQFENPADVKAAERMGKLYDEIKKDNPTDTEEEVHNLNVFLTRLLFCFFAEDTNIFEKSQFTHSLVNHTQDNGSDLHTHFERLFEVMNTEDNQRGTIPAFLNSFPYVNGGLFRNNHSIPQFSRKSRQVIIESGELDWSAINPDIFGSMIQAVITPEHRGGLGMHYTSVPNIMKVIEPLFLNDFYDEFEASKGNPKKLRQLLNRLWNTKYFDPACGSGNFLIIAYKELRKLEMKLFKELNEMALSNITLNQFYGIELDDFAHEVAILSLWLAEHQMNQIFFKEFGRTKPALPLTSAGNIFQGNATRLDWEIICPKEKNDEIFILGNPPYLGSRKQDDFQKNDLEFVFKNSFKSLDYISAWFYKGSNYIKNTKSKCAFVTTNSICQGEQVAITWPRILVDNINIFFAYKDFKWSNNAKQNAGVSVVIIGLSSTPNNRKYIYHHNVRKEVALINPYLVDGKIIYIHSKQSPLSNFPEMNFGNMPADGGKLLFNTEEKEDFISKEQNSEKYFRRLISADEFINGLERWCLWLVGVDQDTIKKMPLVKKRVEELYKIRKDSSRPQLAEIPHLFAQITQPKDQDFILIPSTTSENREYIPIGYFSSENVSHNSCLIIPTKEIYIMGIITSKIHMVWVNSICGRLETRYRYSKDVVYNNFPFPPISESNKTDIVVVIHKVLEVREKYSEKTLAQLYDPAKMPLDLKEAHHQLDLTVERCYRSKPFENDEERLEYLFKLYEQMIDEVKSRGTLFETESKPKKKKK